MRKVIPLHQRKRSLYSCDRCREKKRACKRYDTKGLSASIHTACVECLKKGIKCSTTRKRKNVSQENLGLHYKCLLRLVEQTYPEVDATDIDQLVELGIKLKFKMPSRHEERESFEELHAVGFTIKNQLKSQSPIIEPAKSIENDKFVLDKHGNSHYIGPNSGVAFLSFTSNFMSQAKVVREEFREVYQRAYEHEIVTTNEHPVRIDEIVQNTSTFPYIFELSKSVSDIYVHDFFDNLNLYFPCISKNRFETLYSKLWSQEGQIVVGNLATNQVCLIYMVVVLGFTYNVRDSKSIKSPLVGNLLGTVNLAVAELVVSSDKDSIVVLFLLSLFYFKNRKRECGYLLIEAACRSAMSIGMHRQSILECEPDHERQEEYKKLWWCLFQSEVRFSLTLGRSSTISRPEVTISEPRVDVSDGFDQFFGLSISMVQILHEFVTTYDYGIGPAHEDAIQLNHLEALRTKFDNWFKRAQLFFDISDPYLTTFKYKFKLEYRYFLSILHFQSLLMVCSPSKESVSESVKNQAFRCISLSIDIERLLNEADQYITINSIWSLHLWFAYQATLGLCLGYSWLASTGLGNTETAQNSCTIDQIKQSMILLRRYNLRNMNNCVGSVTRIHTYIEVMLCCFPFMSDERLLEDQTETPNSNYMLYSEGNNTEVRQTAPEVWASDFNLNIFDI